MFINEQCSRAQSWISSLSRSTAAFTFSLLSLSVLLGCAGPNGANAQALSCPQSHVASGFVSKVRLSQNQTATLGEDVKTFLGGTLVTVTLRDQCGGAGPIARSISRYTGRTPAGVRSYNWTLPYKMTAQELETLARQDDCVTMISSAGDGQLTSDAPFTAEPAQLPNDPGVANQLHLTAIDAPKAYPIFYDPNTGIQQDVIIAIIDSGVDLRHEDLRANIWTNPNEIPANGIDDDENGYIDDVHGYNFASRIGDPSPQISSANSSWQWAHGSRVAGLAAAVGNNGVGGTGVMPNAKIMALNAMGTGSGFSQSDEANAIRYAVDNGARVINLSLGGSAAGSDFANALQYAVNHGAVVVAAAGNEGRRIDSSYSAAGLASGIQGLISIGNFRADDFTVSSTSNYSTTYVELGVPGTNTASQGLYSTSPTSDSAYGYFSGTSAATPVAAGAAALAIDLIETRGYTATPAAIENLMLQSAKKVPALSRYFKDGNALNIAALAQLIDQEYPYQGIVNHISSKYGVAASANCVAH